MSVRTIIASSSLEFNSSRGAVAAAEVRQRKRGEKSGHNERNICLFFFIKTFQCPRASQHFSCPTVPSAGCWPAPRAGAARPVERAPALNCPTAGPFLSRRSPTGSSRLAPSKMNIRAPALAHARTDVFKLHNWPSANERLQFASMGPNACARKWAKLGCRLMRITMCVCVCWCARDGDLRAERLRGALSPHSGVCNFKLHRSLLPYSRWTVATQRLICLANQRRQA